MKRVGILVGREQTFPDSMIKSINEKSGGKVVAELMTVGCAFENDQFFLGGDFVERRLDIWKAEAVGVAMSSSVVVP